MLFFSGQWEIRQGAATSVSQYGCALASSGTQLFTHEGISMSNGSWVNVQTNTYTTNVSVYALEDCTYEGAFIDGDFYNGALMITESLSEDYSLCQKKANATGRLQKPDDPLNVNIFTTLTTVKEVVKIRNGFEVIAREKGIWCKFRSVEWFTWAVLKLNQTDENASFTVRGNSCVGGITGRSAQIVNINEALVPTHVDSSDLQTRSNVNETETSIYWVIFGAGARSGFGCDCGADHILR